MISPEKKKKLSLFSIFFTLIVDNLGWALAVPVFTPLFLNDNGILFSKEMSMGLKTIVLGLFLAAFPLFQFIGAPLIGEYADKTGRKKAFVISIFLTIIGYVLTAWAIAIRSLYLIFIGRLITGLFAGNMSICLASVADLSDSEKEKTKNFGYLSVFAGFSFVIGAFLGGKFSAKELSEYFAPALPLWIAAGLAVLNLLFILIAFVEPPSLEKKVKYHFFKSFQNIAEALKIPKLKKIYFIYFLFLFSWNFLFQFGPVLLNRKFGFSYSQIGDTAALIGVCWILSAFFLSKFLSKWMNHLKILEIALLCFILPYAYLGFTHHLITVFVILAICGILAGISWPLFNSIISQMSSKEKHGKIMGISQSILSFSAALAPILAGYMANISLALPFVVAAVFSAFGVGIYIKEKR